MCCVATACFSCRGCWLVNGLGRVCSIGLISLVQHCTMETVLLGVEAHQKVSWCNLKKAFNDGVSMHNVIYFNLCFCICLVLHIKKATWLHDHSYLFHWQLTVFSFLWGCNFPELHNFITIICFLLCYNSLLLLLHHKTI